MNSFLYVFIALSIFVFFLMYERKQTLAKCEPMINDLAKKEGLTIDTIEYPMFKRGPLSFPTTKMQRIFRVTAKKQNQHKVVWIKIGHPLFGLNTNQMEVRFEEN
jgi:hypothetical protein